jgi:3,5-epimerase/4-reductase
MLLIYGGNGWIGKKIVAILESIKTPFLVSTIRADDIKAVEEEIKTVKPTNIMCLLGRTHGTFEGEYIPTIDYLEKKGKVKENVRDNLFCPIALALLCKKYDIHLTYLGTGCIFTYTDGKRIFTEEDEPNFFGSSYSIVKGYTDRLMRMFDNVLNVRIRMPISSDTSPRNFIVKLLKYEKICSMQNSMTVLDELLPIMCDMSIKKETGTVNLTNPGTIEHSEILDMYKEIVDPTFTYNLFSYEDQMKVIACDRSNNELDTTVLSSKYGVKNIKESVRDILIEYKKNVKKTLCVVACHTSSELKIKCLLGNKKYFEEISDDVVYINSSEYKDQNVIDTMIYIDNNNKFCYGKYLYVLQNMDISQYDNVILTNDSYLITKSLMGFKDLFNDSIEMSALCCSTQCCKHYPDFLRRYSKIGIVKLVQFYCKNLNSITSFNSAIQNIEIKSHLVHGNSINVLYDSIPNYDGNIHFYDIWLEEYLYNKNYPIIKIKKMQSTTYFGNKIPTDFKASEYKSLHIDLRDLNDDYAFKHFVNYGMTEGRIYKKNQTLLWADFFAQYLKPFVFPNMLNNWKYGTEKKKIYILFSKNDTYTMENYNELCGDPDVGTIKSLYFNSELLSGRIIENTPVKFNYPFLEINYNTKITIVYFINFMVRSQHIGELVFRNQINKLVKCGILQEMKNSVLFIEASIKENASSINKIILEIVPADLQSKIRINTYPDSLHEYFGAKKIWDCANENPDENHYLLYFHSKGITRITEDNPIDCAETRTFELVVNNWKNCLRVLTNFLSVNKVGPSCSGVGWIWHTFYWARASYVNFVEIPIVSSYRYYYEEWISKKCFVKQHQNDKKTIYPNNYDFSYKDCWSICSNSIGTWVDDPSKALS